MSDQRGEEIVSSNMTQKVDVTFPHNFKGISSKEAEERLEEYGYNELQQEKQKSVFAIVLSVTKEPMFLMLLTCDIIYWILGDYSEAAMLIAFVLFTMFLTIYQEKKTESALHSLRKLSSPRALVIRNGNSYRVPGREVVPGDYVALFEGDRVPADMVVLYSMSLLVDESLLTGETAAVHKDELSENEAVAIDMGSMSGRRLLEDGKDKENGEKVSRKHENDKEEESTEHIDCFVYSGTLVVGGHCVCVTKKTGLHTEIGKIGKSLTEMTQEKTPLESEINFLMLCMLIVGISASVAVLLLYGFTRSEATAAADSGIVEVIGVGEGGGEGARGEVGEGGGGSMGRLWINALLVAISLEMSLLPEEFPVVLQVFLALGAWRISKENVLSRRGKAIELLGAAAVICTDKTGTLTMNRMQPMGFYIPHHMGRRQRPPRRSRDGEVVVGAQTQAQAQAQAYVPGCDQNASPPLPLPPFLSLSLPAPVVTPPLSPTPSPSVSQQTHLQLYSTPVPVPVPISLSSQQQQLPLEVPYPRPVSVPMAVAVTMPTQSQPRALSSHAILEENGGLCVYVDALKEQGKGKKKGKKKKKEKTRKSQSSRGEKGKDKEEVKEERKQNLLPLEFHELVECALLSSQKDSVDPIDVGIREAADMLPEPSLAHRVQAEWIMVREYPISKKFLALSQVWERGPGRTQNLGQGHEGGNCEQHEDMWECEWTDDDRSLLISAKGAPEAIVELCHLSQADAEMVRKAVDQMANQRGLRVLGVARAEFSRERPSSAYFSSSSSTCSSSSSSSSFSYNLSTSQTSLTASASATAIQPAQTALAPVSGPALVLASVPAPSHVPQGHIQIPDDMREFDFRFVGLIGFQDPVREEVPTAIAQCHGAGIRVVMITGDYPATAQHVARQAGIPAEHVLTGRDVAALSDEALLTAVEQQETCVFARIMPEQKLRVVDAFMRAGHVTAMIGDGVNDAPALRKAHIGIAMGGARGTDVAREAADLVLLDDRFLSVVKSCKLGRRIYTNISKAIVYIIAVHVPFAGLAILPIIFGWPVLLRPVHIVFAELLIDPSCSIVFEMEPEEKDVFQRPPRDVKQHVITLYDLLVALVQGVVVLFSCIGVYWFNAYIYKGYPFSELQLNAMVFCTLMIGNLTLIITNRSKTESALSILRVYNLSFLCVLSVALVVLVLCLYVPGLRGVFHSDYVPPLFMLEAVCAGMACGVLHEVVKLSYRAGGWAVAMGFGRGREKSVLKSDTSEEGGVNVGKEDEVWKFDENEGDGGEGVAMGGKQGGGRRGGKFCKGTEMEKEKGKVKGKMVKKKKEGDKGEECHAPLLAKT